ncbi:MAG: lipopolysaccharide kinase InaA family protein [Planctomycetota bacterium]|jgi:tRNA A-37 threonylcarbamoyl transferase component Bud32
MSPTAQDRTQHLRQKVRFADAAAEELLRDHLPALCRPAENVWQRVKHNVSRTVYYGRVGGREIYLKHYHPRSLVHLIARRLGSSDAVREMRFSEYLRSRGVPTPLALAAMCADGFEWLATAAVRPVVRANEWHKQQLHRGQAGSRAIQRMIVALARMIGRMHAAGVIHRDLHCGNILLRTDRPQPEPILSDLHRVRRRRKLSRRAKAANLAQLFHDRRDFTTRTERLRFLKHYLQASASAGTLRGWHLVVEQFARRHTARQNAQRDRRMTGNNRYFTRLKLPGGWRGHAVLESKRRLADSQAAELAFQADDWRRVLSTPGDLFSGETAAVVKDSPSSLVLRRRLEVGPHSLDVFLKRRRRKRPWKIIVDCFRHSRAIRAFKLGHALLTRRIATALPLAALERRKGPFLTDSILITEATEGTRLNQFLDAHLGRQGPAEEPLDTAQQRQLAQEVLWQLGRLLQKLHDNSFYHRDLKAPNMLARWHLGRTPEIILVDLDGLKRVRYLSVRRRFQGLMRLNVSLLKCPSVSHAGRLRMLLGYLRRPGSGRINFKPYWRVLEQWSAKKLTRQIRSRRKRQKAVRRPLA